MNIPPPAGRVGPGDLVPNLPPPWQDGSAANAS